MKEQTNDTSTNIAPIFTGDSRRDIAVSEFEKAAEASQAIYNAITNNQKEKEEGENV